jgi:hypothetical protein
MRKNIVSIFTISALSVSLVAAQTAFGDGSQAGIYDSSTNTTDTTLDRNQQSGIVSDQQPGLYEHQQPGVAGMSDYDSQQPGTTASDDASTVSTADRSDVDLSPLQKEGVAFQPQVGMVNYLDTAGNVGNRMTYGLTASANLPRILGNPDIYLGPQLGFFYSHLGSSNADFLGSSPSTGAVGNAGANMFYIPTDLKLGVNLGNFRPSIHAGANLFYRSVGSSIAISKNPDTGADSAWSYMPNLGLDLEYAFANNFAIVARPDITFGGSNRIWTASVGASIPLG